MDKRLLVVNVHFAPFSFGGATIVAEETATRLKRDFGWGVLVLTAIRDYNLPEYTIRRYSIRGLDVVAVVINSEPDYETDYKNFRFSNVVKEVVAQYRPTVNHLHAVQGLGVDWVPELKRYDSRVVVTLHDCWWLCDRQFMINSDGQYCNQKAVSEDQCRYCVKNLGAFRSRGEALQHALEDVDLLLYPSQFHCDLHVASGFDRDKSMVNRNGINLPGDSYLEARASIARKGDSTIFGFTGGPGNIKGAPLIVQAFESITTGGYQLKIVDSAENIGSTWKVSPEWKSKVEIEFVPAYSQDTMDAFFAGIDVLLFPSQWKESFGLTVREALARDVWVIATDCGAPIEDIVDGENGTIIPFDLSYYKLAEAVQGAIDKDWSNYSNSYSKQIRSFDQQTEELNSYITTLINTRL